MFGHDWRLTRCAHCKLANYWRKRLNKTEFVAYQASQPGGVLELKIIDDRVHISGKAVAVMHGEWLISLVC